MKTTISSSQKVPAWTAFAAGVLLAAGAAMAQPASPPVPESQTHKVVVTTAGAGDEEAAGPSGGASASRSVIRIESIEPGQKEGPAREVTWLGVSTEEVPDALASQLELKPGQGLVVAFVAPDSPAAKADIQKYDVIEKLGDQMLVDPTQLRKLVQMEKSGETIKLTLYRGGKKQTVSVTLAKRTESWSRSTEPATPGGHARLASSGAKSFDWVFANQQAPMAFAGMDKKMVNAEIQRNMEEARKEIQEALRQSAQAGHVARPVAPPTPFLPPMVDVGNNATVTVTKDGASVKTIVRSDDTGTIVIVASPKKRLTAHDPDGKLLFDGEIETKEQQKSVPAKLWEKVKPMLKQIKPAEDSEPEPHARSGGDQQSETDPAADVIA